MCCDNMGADGQLDGESPECRAETVDGYAKEICRYSSVECQECGWAPCDGSC